MQTTITRTRTRPVATPAKTTTTAAVLRRAPVRKVQPAAVTEREEAQRLAKEEIRTLLQSVAKAEADIDVAKAALDTATTRIEDLMREHKLVEESNGVHEAIIKEAFTRRQRSVKPQILRNKVPNDAFWESIDVNLTRLATHITDAEIDAIADIVSPVSQGFVFKLSRKKK